MTAEYSIPFTDPAFVPMNGGSNRCTACKGAKRLCGKDRCPLMIKFYSRQKTANLIDFKDLEGSCPPAVFIGRYGYPMVDI